MCILKKMLDNKLILYLIYIWILYISYNNNIIISIFSLYINVKLYLKIACEFWKIL